MRLFRKNGWYNLESVSNIRGLQMYLNFSFIIKSLELSHSYDNFDFCTSLQKCKQTFELISSSVAKQSVLTLRAMGIVQGKVMRAILNKPFLYPDDNNRESVSTVCWYYCSVVAFAWCSLGTISFEVEANWSGDL